MVYQLVNKLATFYADPRFIIVLTRDLIYFLREINQFYTNMPFFLKIYFLSNLSLGSPSALILPAPQIQFSSLYACYMHSTSCQA
jgi:hypothetical protein